MNLSEVLFFDGLKSQNKEIGHPTNSGNEVAFQKHIFSILEEDT